MCAKLLGFNDVLDVVISAVNFAHALNHRQYLTSSWRKSYTDYKDVLYFQQSQWLSSGKTLKRVLDLRHEIAFYMDSKEKPHEFSNAQWLSNLVFLVDITEKHTI